MLVFSFFSFLSTLRKYICTDKIRAVNSCCVITIELPLLVCKVKKNHTNNKKQTNKQNKTGIGYCLHIVTFDSAPSNCQQIYNIFLIFEPLQVTNKKYAMILHWALAHALQESITCHCNRTHMVLKFLSNSLSMHTCLHEKSLS